MNRRFAHIRDWIFDLDNCLYPASTGLFSLIDERMGAYVGRLLGCGPEEAKRVQKALDIGAHALVDEVEQPSRSRVQAIVEIEDPVTDMGEDAIHFPLSP